MKTWQLAMMPLSTLTGLAVGLWAPWWVTAATLAISGLALLVAAGCVAVGALRDRRRRPAIPLARVLSQPRDHKLLLPTTPPRRCITKRSRTSTAKGDHGRSVVGSGSS